MSQTSNIKYKTSEQPKLSIIVPIYNVAPYLRKCVDSLLAQDYDHYEIILVDDGSTDNSGAICDEYTSPSFVNSLTRSVVIKVIHQENGGLSAARNSGVEVAQGEYIMFVDSDDYIEPNVLSGLIAQVECDNLDVLRFDYQNVRITSEGLTKRYEVFEPYKRSHLLENDYSEVVTDGVTFLNTRMSTACYAVMFIIKRSLLVTNEGMNELTNECIFTPGIFFEDTDWTPRMLLRAKRIASTPMVVYNYLWRTGSITLPTDPIKRKKVLEDKISLIRGFQEQSQFVKDPVWFTWMTSSTAMGVLGMLAKMSSAERRPYLQELKSLHIFPLSTKKEKMLTQRIKIRMANINPSLYCKLMHFMYR